MRVRLYVVFSLLLLIATSAQSAPPKITIPGGPEIRPTGQQYLRIDPETDAVSITYVGLDGLDPFPSEELKKQTRFLLSTRGLAPGTYRFAAIAASATGEQTRVDFKVIIGGTPVGPDVVPLTDLQKAIQEATAQEPATSRKADLAALAKAYREIGTRMQDTTALTTTGQLAAAILTTRKAAIEERLPVVRKIFSAELVKLKLPTSDTTILTTDQRTQVSRLLNQFADLFQEASK